MLRKVEVRVWIDRPVEDVYACVADFDRRPEWVLPPVMPAFVRSVYARNLARPKATLEAQPSWGRDLTGAHPVDVEAASSRRNAGRSPTSWRWPTQRSIGLTRAPSTRRRFTAAHSSPSRRPRCLGIVVTPA